MGFQKVSCTCSPTDGSKNEAWAINNSVRPFPTVTISFGYKLWSLHNMRKKLTYQQGIYCNIKIRGTVCIL